MEANSIVAPLRQVATEDSRELERVCEEVAVSLLDAGVEPPFRLMNANFASDPFLICADRYWRLRFLARPSVRTAAECARWLYEHAPAEPFRTEVEEKWALGYAFITRATEDSPAELNEASGDLVGAAGGSADIADIAYFTTLYHAGKLRSSRRFDELHGFLESSLLALAVGPHRSAPLFTALRAFAACGSRRLTAEHAADLLDHAWYSPQRTFHTVDVCLNALAAATPFPGQGELLRDRAREAATEWPEHHLFVFRLAAGLHLCREHDAALEAIDLALALLPAMGARVSVEQFQEQYLARRELILEGRQRAVEQAAHERRWAEQNAAYRRVEARLNSMTHQLITMITVFVTAIAFIISTVQLSYGGDMTLGDRLWLMLAQGGVMLGFSGVLVLGTHLLLRHREQPPPPDPE